MNLRRKLMAAFAGLALIALLVVGGALFATLRWQRATAEMETHYQRSLLLQRVRAGTYQALAEVHDALTGDHVDARSDFERALRPAAEDFEAWAARADTPAERAEVVRVRAAHQRLIGNAARVFALVPIDRTAAIRLVDDEVDTNDFEQFRLLTERAVEADRARRRTIAAETQRVRWTIEIMLAVSAISILSLVLLIAAYLSHDLFGPLRGLSDTIERLRLGDGKARADADRDDEIGVLATALNAFADSLEQRAELGDGAEGGDWRDTPTRATLHRLVAGLESRIGELRARAGDRDADVLAEIENLTRAVARFTALGFPLDLDLEPVDLAALVHSVVSRHRVELAERAVSLELVLATDLGPVLVDRLKLREAIGEAIRNALDALPANGGRLGLRTLGGDGKVCIEVADDGPGMEGGLIEKALGGDPFEGPSRPRVGLSLARLIAQRHGGELEIFSETGKGSVVQFALPHRRKS